MRLFEMNFLAKKLKLGKQLIDWLRSLMRPVLLKIHYEVADRQQSEQKKIPKLFPKLFVAIHNHLKDVQHVNLVSHAEAWDQGF